MQRGRLTRTERGKVALADVASSSLTRPEAGEVKTPVLSAATLLVREEPGCALGPVQLGPQDQAGSSRAAVAGPGGKEPVCTQPGGGGGRVSPGWRPLPPGCVTLSGAAKGEG